MKSKENQIIELNKDNCKEYVDCPECDGEGQFYEDTRGSCTVYRGDCCGGCGYDVDCENCNGTGLIEKEEEDEI